MEILDEKNEKFWKDYEKRQENLPPQYLLGWRKSIEETYKNCSGIYYFEEIGGEVKSIFPIFIVNSNIFGTKAISQPFLDFGGPFGEISPNFISDCIGNLKEKYNFIEKIEIRLNNFSPDYKKREDALLKLGFKKEFKKNQVILNLEEENLLFDKFSRITRKGIKKAEKSGLEMREIDNKLELDSFYELYVRKMRDFGTPQHSYDFFENFMRDFKNNLKGLNCYKEGKLISSLIVFHSRDYMYAAYNLSESQFLVYQPNDLLHWEMIKWAIKRGIRFFDIGQCDASAEEGTHAAGIYRFKNKWGGKLYDKFYFYLDLSKKSNEIGKESDTGLKYKKAIGIWKKIPLPIVKKIGPKIASQLAL